MIKVHTRLALPITGAQYEALQGHFLKCAHCLYEFSTVLSPFV